MPKTEISGDIIRGYYEEARSIQEVARRLGIPDKEVRELMHSHGISPKKLGNPTGTTEPRISSSWEEVDESNRRGRDRVRKEAEDDRERLCNKAFQILRLWQTGYSKDE